MCLPASCRLNYQGAGTVPIASMVSTVKLAVHNAHGNALHPVVDRWGFMGLSVGFMGYQWGKSGKADGSANGAKVSITKADMQRGSVFGLTPVFRKCRFS